MTESGPKMSLLEAYAALKPDRLECPLGKIIVSLDEADRNVLAAWLADASMTSSGISRLLTHAGHAIHRNTVAEHRREVCRCAR